MPRKKRASRSGHCRKRNRALIDHPKRNASTITTTKEHAGQPPHGDPPGTTSVVGPDTRKPTDQERYVQLREAYGPLNAYAFVHELQDGHGNADWLACAVLEWILDWQRPGKDGGVRYDGHLWFYSANLADGTFGVSNDRLKRARMRLKAAGLVTFHQSGRRTWVEVHWDAIEKALADDRQRRSMSPAHSKDCVTAPPDEDCRGSVAPALGETRCKGAPTSAAGGAMTPGLPPLSPTASKRTSLGAGEEEMTTKDRSLRSDNVTSEARKLIERGRRRGRVCTGKWERMSVKAYFNFVCLGYDQSAISRAWNRYLDVCSERRKDASNASTLGHWMLGLSLKGEPRDYGSQSFEVLYQRALAAIEREAEVEAAKLGCAPEHPKFKRVVNDDRCPWLVSFGGKDYAYDAVGPDATPAECLAAFPEWWRDHNPEADSGLLPPGNGSAKRDAAPRRGPLPPHTLENESGVWVAHWADTYAPTSLDWLPSDSTKGMARGELGRLWANGTLRLSEAESL